MNNSVFLFSFFFEVAAVAYIGAELFEEFHALLELTLPLQRN